MIWGAISAAGASSLHKVTANINTATYLDILSEYILPLDLPTNGLMFIQDNAPAHKSRATMRWFNDHGIEVMDWPPQSPDMNIIENIWGYPKQAVEKHNYSTFAEVWEIVQQEWAAIPVDYIEKLVLSMPARVAAIITAKGGFTTY